MNYIWTYIWTISQADFEKKKEERNNLKEISHSLKIKVLWKRQQILQNTKNFRILILSSGIISNAGILFPSLDQSFALLVSFLFMS